MLTVLLFAHVAQARPVVSAEGISTVALLSEGGRNLGNGFGVRIGQVVGLPAVQIAPEIGFTVWSCETVTLVPDAGLRLLLGRGLQPGAYAHLGYLLGDTPVLGWDAGLSLDLTVADRVQLGGQAGLQRFGASPVVTAGAQLGYVLGKTPRQRQRERRR